MPGEPGWFNYDFAKTPVDAHGQPITHVYGPTPPPNDLSWNPYKGGDYLPW